MRNLHIHKELLNNYVSLVDKAKAILTRWKNRNISIIGKVLIVNILIGSLFVYKMSVLPTISECYVTQLNKIINDFLWNGKRAKIALTTLQMEKHNGGLGLVNFALKDKALKVAWIRSVQQDSLMMQCMNRALNPIPSEITWKINVSPKDIKHLCKDSFWRDVLSAWAELNHHYPDTPEQINNQIIWYNTWIRIQDEPFLFRRAQNNGLNYISQLYQASSILLMPMEIMCEMFNLTVLQWNGIISAIPKEWKFILGQEENAKIKNENFKHNVETFLTKKKQVNFFYHEINGQENKLMSFYSRWHKENTETINFTFDEIANAFHELYVVTNQNRLRSFQYKLLHRVVFLNSKLFQWRIKDNKMCSFCKKKEETYRHFFWECTTAQKVWSWVENIILAIKNTEMIFNYKNIILNKIVTNAANVANFIVLVTKHYMFSQKCLEKIPVQKELETKINMYKIYEKHHALKNDKYHLHERKWHLRPIVEQQTKQNIENIIDEYINDL